MDKKIDPQSSFMFLVLCNETFGYTHEQTLDFSISVIWAMLREYGFIQNERKNNRTDYDDESNDKYEEYIEVYDFDTGQKKKVKKMSIDDIY